MSQRHTISREAKIQTFDSVGAWQNEGKRRFGDDFMLWKFVCPVCKNVASVLEFMEACPGESADIATKECIGRYRKERARPFGEGKDKVAQPCDYAGYGLFRLSPVRVKHADGHETHAFAFAEIPGTSTTPAGGDAAPELSPEPKAVSL